MLCIALLGIIGPFNILKMLWLTYLIIIIAGNSSQERTKMVPANTSQAHSDAHPMMPCAEEIPAVRGQTPITRSIKITVTSCCYGQQTARWLMKTNCCSDGHCKISLQDCLSYLSPYGHMKALKSRSQTDQMSELRFPAPGVYLVVFFSNLFRFTSLKSQRGLKQPLNAIIFHKYVYKMPIQSRIWRGEEFHPLTALAVYFFRLQLIIYY